MVEFFQNAWQAIKDAWPEFSTVFSTGTFATALTAVIALIKQRKTIKSNTAISTSLSEALSDVPLLKNATEKATDFVGKVMDRVDVVVGKVDNFTDKVDAFAERVLTLESKISGIADALSVVYSTIKDDTVRNTVQNILTNTKYTDERNKYQMTKELSELQVLLAEGKSQLQALYSEIDAVKESASKVTEEHPVEEVVENIPMRG